MVFDHPPVLQCLARITNRRFTEQAVVCSWWSELGLLLANAPCQFDLCLQGGYSTIPIRPNGLLCHTEFGLQPAASQNDFLKCTWSIAASCSCKLKTGREFVLSLLCPRLPQLFPPPCPMIDCNFLSHCKSRYKGQQFSH